jgi:transposase
MQAAVHPPQNWQEILLQKDQELAELDLKIIELEQRLARWEKLLFGARSEKRSVASPASQLALFPETEVVTPEPEYQTVVRRKPRSGKDPVSVPFRRTLPAHLPRVEQTLEPEGIDMSKAVRIGEDVTEVLEMHPSKVFVRRIIRPRFLLEEPHKEKQFLQASLPAVYQPLPKVMAGASMLAHLLVSKYEDHLPLYRIIKMFRREKLDLAQSTVTDWVQGSLKLLAPLLDYVQSQIHHNGYLMADESPIGVLDPDKKGLHRGFYWVFYDPIAHLILFIYNKGRGSDAPREVLKDFKGYLQVDGYSVYDQFEKKEGITVLACMAHIRRKFVEALQEEKSGADYVLEQMGLLYAIEAQAREKNLDPESRRILRMEKAAPIVEDLWKWMLEKYREVLPRSAMGKALSYALTMKGRVENYLLDGRLEIDNNGVENKIRPLALGRKNYLFSGSHEAAERAGRMYALLAMCKMAEVNPKEWLEDVLARIQDYPINKIADFLPHNWKTKSQP